MIRPMKPIHFSLAVFVAVLALQSEMVAQVAPSDTDAQLKNALQLIERLASQVAAQEVRIEELEAARGGSPAAASAMAS